MTIIDWNGSDIPAELRALPAGKYVVHPASEALTPEEEHGLVAALESVRAHRGVPHDVVRERILRR